MQNLVLRQVLALVFGHVSGRPLGAAHLPLRAPRPAHPPGAPLQRPVALVRAKGRVEAKFTVKAVFSFQYDTKSIQA